MQKSDAPHESCEAQGMRVVNYGISALLVATATACSSQPLTAPPHPTAPNGTSGFAAVVLTVQGAGAGDQRLRAYGLDVAGDAVPVCTDAGGFDVSVDRRHVACERSTSAHGVSVYTRGEGSIELPSVQSPVFSPQGDRLAVTWDETLYVGPADGSVIFPFANGADLGKVLSAPQWSSSGRYIGALMDVGVGIWDVAQRTPTFFIPDSNAFEWLPGLDRIAATKAGVVQFIDGDAQNPSSREDPEMTGLWPGFSASGEWLAYPRAAEIVLLNHVTGEERSISADIRTSWLAWSPTDDVLAVDDSSVPELRFWSPSRELRTPRPDDAYGTIEWSPDGTLLRDYTNQGSLIYDGATGAVVAQLEGRLQWSPSGQNLTTMTADDSAWLAERVGGAPRLLSDYATRVTWFPDSQHLALQIENELYVTDVAGSALRLVAELAP